MHRDTDVRHLQAPFQQQLELTATLEVLKHWPYPATLAGRETLACSMDSPCTLCIQHTLVQHRVEQQCNAQRKVHLLLPSQNLQQQQRQQRSSPSDRSRYELCSLMMSVKGTLELETMSLASCGT